VQIQAPPLLAGRTSQALSVPGEIHLVAIDRAGKTLLPTPETAFQEGDLLYLAVLAASADRLKSLLA
jgi:trk system potassium uptake protein TrkA